MINLIHRACQSIASQEGQILATRHSAVKCRSVARPFLAHPISDRAKVAVRSGGQSRSTASRATLADMTFSQSLRCPYLPTMALAILAAVGVVTLKAAGNWA